MLTVTPRVFYCNKNNVNERGMDIHGVLVSLLRRKLSPARTLTWRRRSRVQPTCNISGAYHVQDRLVGQVVRCPPRERKIPGSNPAGAGIFSGSGHTSDFKIGTPVATLPGAWRYRVSTGTGRPGVSIL